MRLIRGRPMVAAEDVIEVLQLARSRTGLLLPENASLVRTVSRAILRAGQGDLEGYLGLLATDESAFNSLVGELTVGESYFLREPGQFEYIRREVIPAIRARKPEGLPIVAWSAGCAAGQEAYSIAMVLAEAGADAVQVLGTDIASHRLFEAERGIYGSWSLRGVPPAMVTRYFTRRGPQVEVAPHTRAGVEFRYFNLASEDWSTTRFLPRHADLILCRNVLIYFEREAGQRVLRRLFESLAVGGWLFLGAADPPLAGVPDCEVVLTGAGVAYRRIRRRPRGGRTVPSVRLQARALPHGEPGPARSRVRGTAVVAAGDAGQARLTPPSPLICGASSAGGAGLSTSESGAPGLSSALEAYSQSDNLKAAELAQSYVTRATCESGWALLVRSLSNLARYREAGLACATGLELHPTSAELTYLHALLMRESGRVIEATAALRRAIYLDRSFVVAHIALGDLLLAQGERDAALRSFRNSARLLSSVPESCAARYSDGTSPEQLRRVVALRLELAVQEVGA